MRVLVQKCKEASCTVNGKVTGEIKQGLVLFVGFTLGDSIEEIKSSGVEIVYLSEIYDDLKNKNI